MSECLVEKMTAIYEEVATTGKNEVKSTLKRKKSDRAVSLDK